MLKNVELGPLSADFAKRLAVLPAPFSPFGGSAEIAETKRSEPVITQVNDFLMFIKFSTVLISACSPPRRRPGHPF